MFMANFGNLHLAQIWFDEAKFVSTAYMNKIWKLPLLLPCCTFFLSNKLEYDFLYWFDLLSLDLLVNIWSELAGIRSCSTIYFQCSVGLSSELAVWSIFIKLQKCVGAWKRPEISWKWSCSTEIYNLYLWICFIHRTNENNVHKNVHISD